MARAVSRRQVITYGLGAVAVGSVPGLLSACTSGDGGSAGSPGSTRPGGSAPGTLPGGGGRELAPPRLVQSADGVLQTTLTAKQATVDVGAAKPFLTYTYDGGLPGATWEVKPGDTLKVDLVNDLPPMAPDARHSDNPNRPHDWTTTNLHTHGLHVSPSGKADNIFLTVDPGGRQSYEIPIPEDHTGGFFWYHPHHHGGVAQQVRGGMAGAIIVRGAIDEVPEVKAAKEQLLVVQAIELDKDLHLADPIPDPSSEEAFTPRSQILYPINGAMNPVITMHPGEVQRWRILNAAEGKYLSLRLEGHPLHPIAWDGLTLPAPDTVDDAVLSAGNRLEVLVQAGQPGTYQLLCTPGSSQHPEIPGTSNATTPPGTVPAELKTRPIATVVVTGSGPTMALPKALPAYDPPMPPVVRRRQLTYSVERGPDQSEFINFGVNGTAFDPEAPPYQVKLGTAEEWTVTTSPDPKLPQHAHVFHIHVNPFKVTKINGQPLATPLWRDTFMVGGTNGDSITFETSFDDFTGMFVDHCHVLTHEDLGMMERVEVVP